jgi:HAD superfamily hydrolase (TIGR01509 family)
MAVGCVIFDCDGTLVDSELLSSIALSRALASLSVTESGEALLRRYRGARLANIFADLEARHRVGLPPTFELDYQRSVAEMFETELRAIAGIEQVLSGLSAPACVASSGPRAKIELALRVTGLSSFFAGKIFSSYEIGSWKPEPQLFLHASGQVGVPPDACVVVEDSLLGARAAERARMRCMLFDPPGQHAPEDAFGARSFREMSELLDLLQAL